MTVPVDRTRFKVISDTVITIRSGNDSGVFRTRNKWYPVNKNLNYGDEEIGNQMFSSYKSTTGKPGIGDIYVYDIITSLTTATDSTLLWALALLCIGMKDRSVTLNKNTVYVHPLYFRCCHFVAWVSVAKPHLAYPT